MIVLFSLSETFEIMHDHFPLGTVYGGGYDCEQGTAKGEGIWNNVRIYIIRVWSNIIAPNN